MRYILGIDQGGTKTAAAIMREDGAIIGTAVTKGAYFPRHGIELALNRMEEAAKEVKRLAVIDWEEISMTVAGITGIDWPGEDKIMGDALRKRMHLEPVIACNDMINALYTVPGISHGMVLCAGTGMNGAIIDETGKQFVYGDYMEDMMQGGSALALRAIRKVFDAEMGLCGATALTELFLEYAGADTVDQLLHMFMTKVGFTDEIRFLMPEIMKLAAGKTRRPAAGWRRLQSALLRLFLQVFIRWGFPPGRKRLYWREVY